MKKIFFQGSDLFSNILTLVFGTFLAQMIPIVLQSVLRRIYSAEDFGAIAVFISISGIFVMFTTLRYEMAINLPKKRHDAVNLVFLALSVSFIINLVFFLLILLFKDNIASIINLSPQYSYILYFSPLSIFLFSSYQALNYYLVREKAFKDISANKVSRRVIEGAAQTGLGLLRNPSGLLIGDIVGHITHNITGWFQVMRRGFSFRFYSIKRQYQLAFVYKEFPLVNLVPSFFNAICLNMVVILIAMFYSEEIVGYFDLTRLVLAVPAAMITLSISQVLLQNVSQKRIKGESIKEDIRKILLALCVIAITMVAVILIFAPWAFAIYAGEIYKASGVFSQILVFSAAIKFVVSPISIIFVALKRIKIFSFWQVANFILLCTLYFFRNFDIIEFLIVYVVMDILSYVVLFIMLIRIINRYETSLVR